MEKPGRLNSFVTQRTDVGAGNRSHIVLAELHVHAVINPHPVLTVTVRCLSRLFRAETEIDVNAVNRKLARTLSQGQRVNARIQLKPRHILTAVRARVRHIHQRETRDAIRLPPL